MDIVSFETSYYKQIVSGASTKKEKNTKQKLLIVACGWILNGSDVRIAGGKDTVHTRWLYATM